MQGTQVTSSYSETESFLKTYRITPQAEESMPFGMLGLERVSKRNLSESKKKSKEMEKLAKFPIFIQFTQLCSKGSYSAVTWFKALVQTIIQSVSLEAYI